MSKSAKAALLSGLVFPGLGHFYLKAHRRGLILLLAALAAFSVVVTQASRQAMAIVDRINTGELPIEPGAISRMVVESAGAQDSKAANVALIAFILCWLIAMIDSYRLGRAQAARSG